MRLTFSTDYGLRLLMLVGLEPDRLVTIQEVADRFQISKGHSMKVAYELGQAGYLETVRGRNGGLRLGKAQSCLTNSGAPLAETSLLCRAGWCTFA